MSLKKKIKDDLTHAMKSKNGIKISTLRMAIAAITVKEKEGQQKELEDIDIQKILASSIKQRKDSIELYTKGNRLELAEKEQKEIDIIEMYLPEKVSSEEVENVVACAIEETCAATMKDMGKVMGLAMKRLKETGNLVDGSEVSATVKRCLSGKDTPAPDSQAD